MRIAINDNVYWAIAILAVAAMLSYGKYVDNATKEAAHADCARVTIAALAASQPIPNCSL